MTGTGMIPGRAGCGRPPTNRPLVVLVDDDPSIRETVAFILEMEGFQVVTSPDGEAGLAAVRRLRPRVVLLDVMMPRRDGFQVCRDIRSDRDLGEVAVVMLSALSQQADRERALAAGAHSYLTKPFDENELLGLLRSLTRSA